MIFISKNTVCAIFLLVLLAFNTLEIFKTHKRPNSLIATIMYCVHDFVRPPFMMLDMKIHHILTIILCCYALMDAQLPWIFIITFLETEISTLFLVLKHYKINNLYVNLAFLFTFFYYRIYRLFFLLFQTPLQYGEYSVSTMFYYTAVTLYSLNIYWAWKILHLVKKKKY